jgi:Fic family protein
MANYQPPFDITPLDGKRVLGLQREIQEVQNAFAAYEQINQWQAHSCDDLLKAHAVLMAGLVNYAGHFRNSGVGIYRGKLLQIAMGVWGDCGRL